MRCGLIPAAALMLALLLAALVHAQVCFTCHAANAKAFDESLKGTKGLNCLSCHRGAQEHEKDPTTVIVKPVEFEKVCTDCHLKDEITARAEKIKTNATITHPITVPARHAALATPAPAQQGKGICGPTVVAVLAVLPAVLYHLGRRKRK